ncbi:hypothetical protein B0H17DRAFT_1188653 [Mycena rosella]|uniref:F-box domain-containing protein n=1 Tax=Mycena rosella TaxID=1033263 RepID=A0AAD7FGH7_MYCRO|nr:hypothetical protein B0H17DRAFT_1188653 [Mycena rosella]
MLLTSSVFKEPTLDELWRHQTTFAHILLCMPDGLCDNPVSSGGIELLDVARPIILADWERPRCYLFRVRSLLCGTADAPSKELFETLSLSLPIGAYFFPNLESLSWIWMADSRLSCIRTVLSPRITDLHIEIGDTTPISALSLIPTFAVSCPELTRVHISGSEWSNSNLHLRTQTSLLLRMLTRVTTVYVSELDQAAFEHLATLSTLIQLWVRQEFIPSIQFLDVPHTNLFPCLQTITLWPKTIESVITWLRFVSDSPLSSLDIEFDNTAVSVIDNDRLCRAVAEHCSTSTLHSLEISAPISSWMDHLFAASPAQYLKSAALVRLFVFRNFVSSLIGEVARAWPKLRSLALFATCPTHIPRRITLGGLRMPAHHCLELTAVTLEVNALIIPTVPCAAEADIVHNTLAEIHVGHSPISDVSGVVAKISAEVTFNIDADGEPSGEVSVFQARWKAVEDKLTVERDAAVS